MFCFAFISGDTRNEGKNPTNKQNPLTNKINLYLKCGKQPALAFTAI